MFNTEIVVLIITNIVAPIITGTVTWLQAKKKYNVEVDSNLINNMKESLDFYKQVCDDQKDRVQDLIKRNDESLHRQQKLEEEVADLRKQLNTVLLSICTDLTCKHRITEDLFINNRYSDETNIKENCEEA